MSNDKERKTSGRSDRKPDGGPGRRTASKSGRKSDGKSDHRAAGGFDRKAGGKPERGTGGRSDGKSDRRTAGKSDRKFDGKSDRRTAGKFDRKSDGKSDRRTVGGFDRKSDGDSDRRTAGGSDRRPDGEPERGTVGGFDRKSDRKAGDKPDRKPGGGPQKKPRDLRTAYLLLAGGAGRRLWPSSREFVPKPLLRPGLDKSLLESAVSLISSCEHSPDITVLAGAEQEKAFRSHLDGIDTAGARVALALEPLSRNTAPAIALGCMRALDLAADGDGNGDDGGNGEDGEDVIIAALPSDHFVDGKEEFKLAISAAVSAAVDGRITVIGVRPSRPETGYGYISAGGRLPSGAGKKGEVFTVARFAEKPDEKTAARYVKDGFLWNCGIFVFRATVMLGEIKKHAPEVFAAVRGAFSKTGGSGTPDTVRYARSPDISIDYAVMEKTDLGAVVPANFGWSDVGSWRAVHDIAEKGKRGNFTAGDAVVEDCENCLVLSGGDRLVTTAGLKDIAVVDEGDALLVADMNKPEAVRTVAARLATEKRHEALLPARREHKWGSESEIENGGGFSVRSVIVREKAKYEPPAAGYVIALSGGAVATVASKGVRLSAGDVLEIPDGVPVRIKNGGGSALRLLEVAFKREE